MPSIAHLRKQGLYFRLISEIIHQVRTPKMIISTVTQVKLSNDCSHLTVYLNFEKDQEKSLQILENAKGFVRSQLASNINQRIVPEIHFKIDASFEHGKRIDEILKKIKEESKNTTNS